MNNDDGTPIPSVASVIQMRLVIEVDDLDIATAFYRDKLGLAQEFFVEVTDVDTATTHAIAGGAEQVSAPTETPWRSRNARLNGPGPIHFTLFEELD